MVNITEKFLRLISRRLSSRDDCKNSEYLVRIYNLSSNTTIVQMVPDVNVYKDLHHRQPSDKMNILLYAAKTVELKVVEEECLYTCYQIKVEGIDLEHGIYRYQRHETKVGDEAKSIRKWAKVM